MYLATQDVEEIVSAIVGADSRPGDVVAVLVGEKDQPDIEKLIAALNDLDIDFFGGIFPGVIDGDQRHEQGVVFTWLPALAKPILIRGLETENVEIPDVSVPDEGVSGRPTAIVIVDGLAANIASFLSRMFDHFGDVVSYLGGGAGSLSLQQAPCVFTPEGLFQDAAIMTFVALQSSLGIRHGWREIAGPLIVTSARKNAILELNWQPAFEVYQEVVEADTGQTLTKEGFFDIAKGYPFGIYREGAEHIVRDPIIADDQGALICVGEVPENAVLDILKGEADNLVQAASQTAAESIAGVAGKLYAGLVIDCISRVLFLEEDFGRELAAVFEQFVAADSASVLLGMLTLGEISSTGEGLVEFYNKTMVIGGLYE